MIAVFPPPAASDCRGKCVLIRLGVALFTLTALLPFGSLSSASAATFTWTNTAGGTLNWGTATNWQGSDVPDNVPGDIADLSQQALLGGRTIQIPNGTVTLGTLIAGDQSNASDTLLQSVTGGGGLLNLNTGDITVPEINVVNRTLTISGFILGTQGFQKTGAGTLVLSSRNNTTFSGIVKVLNGTLQLSSSAGIINSQAIELGNTTGTNSATLDIAVTLTDAVTVRSGSSGTMTIAKSTAGGATLSGGIALEKDVTFNIASGSILNIGTSSTTGVITGTRGILKNGDGQLNLVGSAAVSYSGGTVLNAGTIGLFQNAALGSGTLTINGGTLDSNSSTRSFSNAVQWNGDFAFAGTAGSLSMQGSVTISGARTVTVAAGSLTMSGVVGGTGGLTKSGGGTLFLTNASNSYSGGTLLKQGTLSIASDSHLGATSGGLVFDGGTLRITTNMTFSETSRAITLEDGGGTFDIGTSQVIIRQNLTGDGALIKTGNGLHITAVTANTYAGGTTILSGSLVLSGPGTNTNHSYLGTGDVNILNGSLVFAGTVLDNSTGIDNTIYLGDTTGNAAAAITQGTNRNVGVFSHLVVQNSADGGSRQLNGGAARSMHWERNVTLNSDLAILMGTLTFTGTISGSGGLIIDSGSNNIILNNLTAADSSWSGITTINFGTLKVNNTTKASLSSATTISFTSSPTATTMLDLSSLASQTIAGLQGGTSTSVTVSLGAAALTINNSNDLTYDGTITGSGSLVKQGAGIQTLTGSNTFTGNVSISAGVLSISDNSNLGATVGSLNLAGGTLRWTGASSQEIARGVNLAATSTVEIVASSTTVTIGSNLTGSGNSFTKLGAGRLVLSGVSNTYDGTTTISAGTLHITRTLTNGGGIVAIGTAGTLQGSGLTSILRNVTVTGNGTLSFAGGSIGGTLTATGGNWTGDGSVGGAITINPGTFTISSSSTLTASGLTTINSSGVLNLAGTLSGSASLAGGTITGSGGAIGGTLAVTGGAWSGSGTVNGAISATAGTFTLSSGATLTSTAGATVNGTNTWNNNGTLAGNISLASGGTISGSGGIIIGTLSTTGGAWSGSGTVNGVVSQTAGTFNLTNSGTLTTGSTVSISGGTFNVLAGSTLNNAGNATVTGSATLSANGIISGGVIVNNGGTLHGNGTISGSVTINSGGNLSAGNSVGHLTVDDDMTWNSGSNQVFEISDADMLGTPGTDWDLITVNGELTLNATPGSKINLKFDSWPPGVPLENFDALDSYSWLWITTTGGIDVGSYPVNALFNFTLGPEFAGDFPLVDVDNFNVSLSLDGLNMYVNYTIAVVPEPGTMLLASLAAAGLGVYGRRRRSKLLTPPATPTNLGDDVR